MVLSPQRGKGLFFLSQLPVQPLLTVSVQPPCAIARINICAHVKNPKHWQPYHCLDLGKCCTLVGIGSTALLATEPYQTT